MSKIINKEGKSYVSETHTSYTEPKQVTVYYELCATQPDGAETDTYDSNNGGYPVYLKGNYLGFYRLINKGQTIAAWSEETVVAPPKVRKGTEVRWNGAKGCWEKRSQRAINWIPCPLTA